MRITTKFRFSIFFSIILVLLVGITEVITFKRLNDIIQKHSLTDQIVRNAFDLNLITYEYLLEHSERVQIQWHLRHERLSGLLRNIQIKTVEEQLLFDKIKRNHEDMKTIFTLLVETPQTEIKSEAWLTEFQERFAGQLLVKSQSVMNSAEQLNEIGHEKLIITQRDYGWIVLLMVMVITLAIVINSLFISKSITKPITILCHDAEFIGKGNLNHQIAINTSDEIGELSRIFNQMTRNLALITVSRDRLTKEVNERKKTEAALRKVQDELIQANKQLQQEITEHEIAEQKLRQMQAYLKNIVDSMPSVLVGMDTDERITFWNLEAEKETGIASEKAKGQILKDIFPIKPELIKTIRETILSQKSHSTQKIPTQSDGEIRYSDMVIYPLITNGVDGVVLRIDDVTDRVRLEEMMIQTEKMMSVGGLAAGMAHEINNPLGGIIQSTQNILRRISPELPKNIEVAQECNVNLIAIQDYLEKREIVKFLQGIQESGDRAAKIVQNMLNFSRRSESRMDSVSLPELLDRTLELAAHDYDLKKKYDFKDVRIIREYEPNMPRVTCVATEIEQVILNLLKNAAQAMGNLKFENGNLKLREATDTPCITLRLYRDTNIAHIEIEDNGPGMNETVCKRVFEPFFTTKPVGVGTGLGLSVSYFIITNNHKGKMTVESVPGKGSRFTIYLPLQRTNS